MLCLGLMAPALSAQPLSITEAFRLALDGHPLVQQRRSDIGAAEYEIKGARWKRFPTLTAEVGRQPKEPSVITTNSDLNSGVWRVEQPLWTGGRITSEIGSAEIRKHIAELTLEEVEQELLTRVAQAYSDCLRMEERTGIAGDNLVQHQRLFDLIKRRTAMHVSSEVDVSLAHARLQQARTELMTLQAALNNARTTLAQLIGNRKGDTLKAPPDEPLVWSDVAAALEAASQYSPFLRRLDAEKALAQSDVVNKRSAAMPQVSARYEKFTGSSAAVPFDRWMLAVQYQPGAGLASMSAIDASVKRLDAAQSAVDAGLRDTQEKVSNQYNECNSLQEQMAPTLQYAQASDAVMASYLRQYTAGRKTWQEVLNAQRELAQARYAVADVGASARASKLKLDILTGRLTRASLKDTPVAAL